MGFKAHIGVTLTNGSFYTGPAVASSLQVNADAGALSVEMENATLFCIGTVRGIRTGAIATIDGSPFNWDKGDYDPDGKLVSDGKRKMMMIGLKVAKKIAVETHDEIKTIDQDKLMKKPFSAKESMLLFEFYKNNNLFDYI